MQEEKGNRADEREFSVSEKVVRDWQKQKEILLKFPKTKRAFRSRQAFYPKMEKELAEWVINQRSSGRFVTILHTRLQALKMRPDSSFTASNGWTHHFMQRYGLCIRHKTRIALKVPCDFEEKITEFHKFVLKQRKRCDFELGQIGNMDEIPVF